jgi:hypothetical protein
VFVTARGAHLTCHVMAGRRLGGSLVAEAADMAVTCYVTVMKQLLVVEICGPYVSPQRCLFVTCCCVFFFFFFVGYKGGKIVSCVFRSNACLLECLDVTCCCC